MKYYRLLTSEGYPNPSWKINKIYPESYSNRSTTMTVEELRRHFPTDWAEVPEYEYYLQEGLPEKWCIKHFDEALEWIQNNAEYNGDCVGQSSYYMFPCDSGENNSSTDFPEGYTEITFKTFKRLILNKSENMERAIIGYKLKESCEKYREVAKQIKYNYNKTPSEYLDGDTNIWKGVTDANLKLALEEAGVWDLWFEPVYKQDAYKIGDWIMEKWPTSPYYNKKAFQIMEINTKYATIHYSRKDNDDPNYAVANLDQVRKATPEEIKDAQYPQITINDCKGEFFNNYMKFGCAYINKEDILRLNKVINDYFPGERDPNIIFKSVESITIGKGTFTKKQIKEIAEYYLNK